MDAPEELKEVLAEGHTARPVEDGIYCVLPEEARPHHYDKRAKVYDLIVGTRLYNRIMWGNSPLNYVEFAQQAIRSSVVGRFLDAGCGSLLFTAKTYLESGRRIIAFDQSLAMLRRARARLIRLSGSVPEHVLLLQADLSDLPFRSASFQTILCLNVLHQFEDAAALLPNLMRLLADDGHLYLTSLISNNRFVGDRYLSALHAAGEFVRPRSRAELEELLDRSFGQKVSYKTKGNMAYITTAVTR